MNRATVARRIRANGMGVLGIWLLCCGGPGVLLAQRDSAATEAEMQDDRLAVERGDPHRDPDLGQLDPMASVFYGAEHIPQFLAAWNALLRGDATARPSTAPLEVVHFGGSHVQAGRIGWSSPIARALRGAAIGDVRRVILPSGEKEYEVMAIRYPG